MTSQGGIGTIFNAQTVLISELERKKRLLRLFALIASITGLITEVIVFTNIFTRGYLDPLTVVIVGLFFVTSFTSWWLAGKDYYAFTSRLLIFATTVIVVAVNFIYGTTLPLIAVFMLPIVMASILLEIRETIAITIFSGIFGVVLALVESVFHIYKPLITTNTGNSISTAIFFGVVLIPVLVALITIPARQQSQALLRQNRQLADALAELASRQQSSQEVSQRVLNLSSELRVTASQQASGSQEQAASLAQVNTSVTELSVTANQIADLARQVTGSIQLMADGSQQIERTARLSASQSQQGTQAVQRTIAVSQEVATLYDDLQTTLKELNLKSVNMRQILGLLKSIAEETHLLALNASIEAAGAGQYGERFGVVAQEVKQLAERANRTNQEVVAVVREIEAVTGNAVTSVEVGYKKALQMEQVAGEAGSVISRMQQISLQAENEAVNISSMANEVYELAETIKMATNQQRSASEQVLAAVSGVSTVAKQSADSSVLISSTATDLEEMSHNLNLSLAA